MDEFDNAVLCSYNPSVDGMLAQPILESNHLLLLINQASGILLPILFYSSFAHIETIKLKAVEYCTNVRASPDGYLFCMDKLFKTNKIEQVKFFCFVVIHDAISYRYILSFLFDMKRCIVLDALLSREKNSSFVEFFF